MFGVKPKSYQGDQLLRPAIIERKSEMPESSHVSGLFDTSGMLDYILFESFHPSPRLVKVINESILNRNLFLNFRLWPQPQKKSYRLVLPVSFQTRRDLPYRRPRGCLAKRYQLN